MTKKIKRLLYRIFRMERDTPERMRRWLVMIASLGIIVLFAFSLYMFSVDMKLGFTEEQEAFRARAAASVSTTATETAAEEGGPESVKEIGLATPQAGCTAVPASALPGEGASALDGSPRQYNGDGEKKERSP